MTNRLEPINLVDFVGGLNLRKNQFQLSDNESPELLNVEIDPRGGFYSRQGWTRRDTERITLGTWNPRNAFFHTLSTGIQVLYLANEGQVYAATGAAPFEVLPGITLTANPHLADFAAWGDVMYVASGATEQSAKRTGIAAMAVVPQLGPGNYNDEYTNPTGGRLPSAEFFETHSGYLFAAYTEEGTTVFPNRIRWSHPNQPEDWAEDDFIDLQNDGSYITGIVSFKDHLVIFKEHSMWALYGYDAASWQLVQVSATVGATSLTGITKSSTAVYFFCPRNSPAIYGYGGDEPIEISEALRVPFNELSEIHEVYLGFSKHRLWVTVPWSYDGATAEAASAFVFDTKVGDGAWVMHSSLGGAPGPYFQGARSLTHPMAAIRGVPAVMELESNDSGFDEIIFPYNLAAHPSTEDLLETPGGDTYILLGSAITQPDSYYRTRWLDAGWPTRKKSWRRPDYICREYGFNYQIRVQIYRDHEERIRRAHIVDVGGTSPTGGLWGDFNWNDGTLWGEAESSGVIERGSSLGLARAVQLRFQGPNRLPGRWGVDAIVLKYVSRRFR